MTTTTQATSFTTTVTTAFNATVEFFTPLASVLGEATLESGKALAYTAEATAGTALQAATGLRMGAQACAAMAPKTSEEASANILLAMATVTALVSTAPTK